VNVWQFIDRSPVLTIVLLLVVFGGLAKVARAWRGEGE
jgi:hypothetical protein